MHYAAKIFYQKSVSLVSRKNTNLTFLKNFVKLIKIRYHFKMKKFTSRNLVDLEKWENYKCCTSNLKLFAFCFHKFFSLIVNLSFLMQHKDKKIVVNTKWKCVQITDIGTFII